MTQNNQILQIQKDYKTFNPYQQIVPLNSINST